MHETKVNSLTEENFLNPISLSEFFTRPQPPYETCTRKNIFRPEHCQIFLFRGLSVVHELAKCSETRSSWLSGSFSYSVTVEGGTDFFCNFSLSTSDNNRKQSGSALPAFQPFLIESRWTTVSEAKPLREKKHSQHEFNQRAALKVVSKKIWCLREH